MHTQAHAWSPFGPRNFEDCVLENMKGVTSDSAAGQIRAACRKKFPEKQKDTSQEPQPRYGIPRINVWDGPRFQKAFSNVTIGKTSATEYGTLIPVTNKNDFNLTGIYVGLVAKGRNQNICYMEKDAYSEIYECDGNVRFNTTANVSCGKFSGRFCIVGLKGEVQLDLDKFFENIKN